jgi:hypothetical protein
VLFRRLGRKGVSGDLKSLIQWDTHRELWTEAGKWKQQNNVTITILGIIHHPVFYLKLN